MLSTAADESSPFPTLEKERLCYSFIYFPVLWRVYSDAYRKNCMNYLLWPKLGIRSLAAGIPGHGRKSLFWGRDEVEPSICSMCSPTCHFPRMVSAENRHFLSKTGQTHRLKPPTFLPFASRGKDAMCWISSADVFRFTDSELPAVKRTWRSFVISTPSSIMEGQQQDSSRRLNRPTVSTVVLVKLRWNRKINGSNLVRHVQNANVASE